MGKSSAVAEKDCGKPLVERSRGLATRRYALWMGAAGAAHGGRVGWFRAARCCRSAVGGSAATGRGLLDGFVVAR